MITNKKSQVNGIFIRLFLIISFVIFLVIFLGDKTYPKVLNTNINKEFYHPNEIKQILLNFNREIDHTYLEKNFQTNPKINGKFSYLGKKVAFTFDDELDFDQKYTFNFGQIKDKNGIYSKTGITLNLSTIGRQIIYVGNEGNDLGKLIKYDLKSKTKSILVDDILVWDFKIHPSKKYIYFLGSKGIGKDKYLNDINSSQNGIITIRNLYKLDLDTLKYTEIFKGENYIYDFFISYPGNIIAVDKLEQKNSNDDRNIWIISHSDGSIKKIESNNYVVSYPIFISPDERYLLGFSPDGAMLIDIDSPSSRSFLGDYYDSYGFSSTGNLILFSELDDSSKITGGNHLVLLGNNQEKKIMQGIGFIASPRIIANNIYFLLAKKTSEIPIFGLMKYDILSGQLNHISENKDYSIENYNISSDGKVIILHEFKVENNQALDEYTNNLASGKRDNCKLRLIDEISNELIPLKCKDRMEIY